MKDQIKGRILARLEDELSSGFDHLCWLAVQLLHDLIDSYSWVGIYMVSDDMLHLTSWKGPAATEHTRIPVGEGICGSAAASGRTEIVDDVGSDDRYISCFVSTKSEIVVPIVAGNSVIGEIDIDSDMPAAFGSEDQAFLEKVAAMLSQSKAAMDRGR
jgi:GAF domain-containing protein